MPDRGLARALGQALALVLRHEDHLVGQVAQDRRGPAVVPPVVHVVDRGDDGRFHEPQPPPPHLWPQICAQVTTGTIEVTGTFCVM